MDSSLQGGSENFHRRPVPSSHFYQAIYAEIEEIGWEHLLRLEEDLSTICFQDKKERVHAVEMILPRDYPQSAPSVAAWPKGSRLKDAMKQFLEHLEDLQGFWSVLEEVDRDLWVLEPRQESHAASFRQICLGDGCQILLYIDAKNPMSKPECRFLGPNWLTDDLRKSWKKNSRRWVNDKPFVENLGALLGMELPGPPGAPQRTASKMNVGSAMFISSHPVNGTLGTSTGTAVDYTCENPSCRKSFHVVCLRDWLRSITTTRQSFDVLFGKCPYCSEPVAVKLHDGG
ncbi:unnamed protein product [Spirodela intermedia]|uniref:Uncharacterized protein n=1 Tax=Spirodela intermedia TaxID=51605 RepID=A0A7I8IJL5_SPIIN|nr:unnamed protein product [Spirodela intermedia]CAA6657691.1 unnamed protein product [Spirodela intermedia]